LFKVFLNNFELLGSLAISVNGFLTVFILAVALQKSGNPKFADRRFNGLLSG
jgi:hypothetical protein